MHLGAFLTFSRCIAFIYGFDVFRKVVRKDPIHTQKHIKMQNKYIEGLQRAECPYIHIFVSIMNLNQFDTYSGCELYTYSPTKTYTNKGEQMRKTGSGNTKKNIPIYTYSSAVCATYI